MLADFQIAIVGLGYVGLPLAMAFSEKSQVIGFDVDQVRVNRLLDGIDDTNEVASAKLLAASNLVLTSDPNQLADCNCYIVTVPTPVDRWKRPDLKALTTACKMIGGFLKAGDIVIFESTVFPGATEDVCGVILADQSGLKLAKSDDVDPSEVFYLGYSPERINPGDSQRRLENLVKVTSGSTSKIAIVIDQLYSSIIVAGTHVAPSIRVAEAAKVIENTQRDVNIALINELAQIFNKIGLDTEEVLAAAQTKWNFLPFSPGLVGGHCIGVDPYYLTHKAMEIGHHPEMILAGRRINDSMARYLATRIIQLMLNRQIELQGAKVLMLGITFKENCPDTRNSKVFDLINELEKYGCQVDAYDPHVTNEAANAISGFNHVLEPSNGTYDAIIVAVAHAEFKAHGASKLRRYGKSRHVLFDVKYVFSVTESDGRL